MFITMTPAMLPDSIASTAPAIHAQSSSQDGQASSNSTTANQASASTPSRAAPKLKFIDSLKDVQLYLKPKFDMFSKWDQEFGVQAKMLCYGNFYAVTNLCYDPKYPIKWDVRPRYSLGFQFAYAFTSLPWKLAIYTKPKTNLIGLWKEETGITGRLYTSPTLIISANVAYVFNYPYTSHQAPQWLTLLNFQFPIGR